MLFINKLLIIITIAISSNIVTSYIPQIQLNTVKATTRTTSALSAAGDDDLIRTSRSSRRAQVGDRVVELKRPLGVVLE